MDIITLYPDIAARAGDAPPSCIEEEARAWASREPAQWTPDREATEPADVLAVIGAMALSGGIRRPLGWDGETLRGPIDPVRMIAACELRTGAVRGQSRLHIIHGDALALSLPPHQASKLWGGQVTTERIWETNMAALRTMQLWADARAARDEREYGPDMRVRTAPRIAVDTALEPETIDAIAGWAAHRDPPIKWPRRLWSPAATGYDDSVVVDASRAGFSAAQHYDDIVVVGHRPARELLSLIGAAYVEHMGRWPTPGNVRIPAIAGIALRDRLDLDRLLLIGDDLRCELRVAGKRGYLVAP